MKFSLFTDEKNLRILHRQVFVMVESDEYMTWICRPYPFDFVVPSTDSTHDRYSAHASSQRLNDFNVFFCASKSIYMSSLSVLPIF